MGKQRGMSTISTSQMLKQFVLTHFWQFIETEDRQWIRQNRQWSRQRLDTESDIETLDTQLDTQITDTLMHEKMWSKLIRI